MSKAFHGRSDVRDDSFTPLPRIWLNGELQKRVVMVDTRRGILERQKLDEQGRIIIDRNNDCIETETLHGIVMAETE